MNRRTGTVLRIFAVLVSLGVAAVMVIQLVAVGQPEDKWLNTLDPQGANAQTIQNLVTPVFWIAGLIGLAVFGAVGFIVWRYRERAGQEDEVPPQLHGNSALEIGWTLLPALILLVVAVLTVATIRDLNTRAESALHVKVYGQQWWWGYTYDLSDGGRGNGSYDDPEDLVTSNEMVIPVGREIALDITSNDVIHSFWIPALNGKKDAVPGMINEWKLQADAPGVYRGQCTEFCGLSHANMRMVVRAVPAAEFDTWLSAQRETARKPAPGSVAAAGEEVFKAQLCSSCHLIRGVNDEKVKDPEKGAKALLVAGVAPDLTHFASRGTFAGGIFNRSYPNPDSSVVGDQPFGQTCVAPASGSGGAPAQGESAGAAARLPVCPAPGYSPNGKFEVFGTAAPGNPDNPPYNVQLAEWLRNPPGMKPMAADEEPATIDTGLGITNPNPAAGKRRGMPNLKLSETQIDQLTAYLQTLK